MPSWTATTPWVWLPESTPTFTDHHSTGRFVLFRKEFTCDKIPQTAPIHVSADTRYRLFINDESVLFGPAKSYLNEWNYETIDIAPYLRTGRNVLAAKVLRYSPVKEGNMGMARAPIAGFILGDENVLGISTSMPWKCIPDDSVRILPSSEWNRALGPAFLQINEDVDGNLAVGKWLNTDFDDSHWFDAVQATMKVPMLPITEPWRLVPRSIPLLPETSGRFSAVVKVDSPDSAIEGELGGLITQDEKIEFAANTTTTVIFENQNLITAFLELSFKGGANSKITIRCAECFEYPQDGNPNPFARNKGNRSDTNGMLLGPEDVYNVATTGNMKAANEETTYEPFWHRTFRYIQLTISTSSAPLTITGFTYRRTHYPLDIATALTNIPALESQKWSISINTLLNCMQETYTDCPFYEQNQFAFDSRLQMLYSYHLSPDDRLARKTINEFHASRRGCDGLVETHFPTPFPGVNIPIFSLSWVLMVYDFVMYSGDIAFVKRYLGAVDSILDYFDSRIVTDGPYEGMVGRFETEHDNDTWAFVDWTKEWSVMEGGEFKSLAVPPAYRRTGIATYNSLVYAYALQKAGDVCRFVGREGTAAEYRERASQVNAAVMKNCLRSDSDGEFIVDGPDSPDTEQSQHAAVYAVLSGAVTGNQAHSLLRRALCLGLRDSYVQCSYAQSFYVLEAAVQVGIYDELRDDLLQPWKDMMDLNLTTWAESAAMPRSDCHGWSAVPIHDVVANVVGLRPVGPGFKDLSFSPRLQHWDGTGEGTFNLGIGSDKGRREVRVSWDEEQVSLTVGFDVDVAVGAPDRTPRSGEVQTMKKGQTLSVPRHAL
ncbi:Six-hairpin glycosidase-like protein [Aspergillus stella-maris]|uniref:Six-hairpin glycosidase-like protein n=1 Tax=Aspergillus stella-maris TaxID=1810926 RepID=UPI003CCE5370